MINAALALPMEEIAAICRRYHVQELSLFGSALRDDFRVDSDLDFLVVFEPGAKVGLFEFFELQHDLQALLGREVDLVSKAGVERSENWIRRRAILSHYESIYVAG